MRINALTPSPMNLRHQGSSRRLIAIVCLMIAFAMCAIPAHAAGLGETWFSPTATAFSTPNVSDPTSDSSSQDVAADGSTVLAVWTKGAGANSVIQVARSTDGGAVWGAPVNVSTGTYGVSRPQVALSGSNGHIVWVEGQPGFSGYRVMSARSSDGGATWSVAVNISATGEMRTPRLAASGSQAVVQWVAVTIVNTAAVYTLQSASTANAGSTWTAATNISPGYPADPKQAVAMNGTSVISTWSGTDGSNVVIWELHSSDGGATWSIGPVQVSASGRDAGDPQVAVSGSAGVVTWKRSNGSEDIVQAARTSNGGAAWGAVIDLSATGLSASQPQVAMDGSAVVVAWKRSTGPGTIIQVQQSSDAGATWGLAPTDISGSGTAESELQLALSGSTVIATWSHFDGVRKIITSAGSANAGVAWADPVFVSSESFGSELPRVGLSSVSAVIVWTAYPTNNGVTQAATGGTASPGAAGTSVTTAQFTFWLEDGRECTSMSPQVTVVGSMYRLPGSDAQCGYDGSIVTGWRIPGQRNAFEPGRVVPVVDSQQFTAVLEFPWVQVKYDANVSALDSCLSTEAVDVPLVDRTRIQWIPREQMGTQVLPSTAVCAPPGYAFAGWADRRGAAGLDGAKVRAAGEVVPAPAVDEDGNEANVLHLYAVWRLR